MTTPTTDQKDLSRFQMRDLVIRQLALEGVPHIRLAAMFDLEPSTVARIVAYKRDAKIRELFGLPPADPKDMKDVTREQAIKKARHLWRTTRLSKAAIARAAGISQQILNQHGVFAETTFD
ncbi:hypothetical protein AYI82_06300 [Shewanella algae]|uniref:hypothetical protein n=1 Tax=Shewanella algae TaxID=38313 RepID=UPI00118313CC|nr:hypothetical protein [Shewanella algae]TVL10626.1 hypothetical protein AYI82_06300 [Shewanella algae]